MKEVSTISKRKSRSRPQNRRQQPRPVKMKTHEAKNWGELAMILTARSGFSISALERPISGALRS